MKTLALVVAFLLAACSQSNSTQPAPENEWVGIWVGTFEVVHGPSRGVISDATLRIDHSPPQLPGNVQGSAQLDGLTAIAILHGDAIEIGRLDLHGPSAHVVLLAETPDTALALISLATGNEVVASLQQMATWTPGTPVSPRR